MPDVGPERVAVAGGSAGVGVGYPARHPAAVPLNVNAGVSPVVTLIHTPEK